MPETYKLKPQFLKAGLGLVQGLAPDKNISEAIEKIPFDREAASKQFNDVWRNILGNDAAVVLWGALGSAIGSPFGFLPILNDFSVGQRAAAQQASMRVTRNTKLSVAMVIEAWRRGLASPELLADYFDDLRSQGFSEDRIAVLKQLASIMPNPQDLIRFVVREVYTPEIAEKYGQFDDFPDKAVDDAAKIGISKDLLGKYWAAHWELPSIGQGFEMMHRGIISEDDLRLLLKAVDVMPYWRGKLAEMSWNVPTRVDVRRWWDMGVVNEAELRKLYAAMGYHGDDLDKYVLWTKIYSAAPDLISLYQSGTISDTDVVSELVGMGFEQSAAQGFADRKIIKPWKAARTQTERNLTKAEIVKGVKKNVITYENGKALLVQMGYDANEADYILEINIGAGSSPDTPLQFQDWINKQRKAEGKAVKDIPKEVLDADKIALETGKKEDKQRVQDLRNLYEV